MRIKHFSNNLKGIYIVIKKMRWVGTYMLHILGSFRFENYSSLNIEFVFYKFVR